MNLCEDGFADSDEMESRTRRAVPGIVVSLLVAFFAYLGLAIGGGMGSAAGTETNGFSSGKGTQPLYLSLREVARGIVAAERSVEPKESWHDGNAALVASPPSLSFVNPVSPLLDISEAASVASLASSAYLARAPPVPAA